MIEGTKSFIMFHAFDIFSQNYDFENELWIGLRKVRERGIER